MVDDEALDAARERYRIEREKRRRDDGLAQYREVAGDYEAFDHDPWADHDVTRDAIAEDVDVVILGAGYGGMFNAIGLLQRGITNIRIVEKAGDVGGTWYWNRYPGCMCDVESYIYLPFLELCRHGDHADTRAAVMAAGWWARGSRRSGGPFRSA